MNFVDSLTLNAQESRVYYVTVFIHALYRRRTKQKLNKMELQDLKGIQNDAQAFLVEIKRTGALLSRMADVQGRTAVALAYWRVAADVDALPPDVRLKPLHDPLIDKSGLQFSEN